jgi:hypothetical protein
VQHTHLGCGIGEAVSDAFEEATDIALNEETRDPGSHIVHKTKWVAQNVNRAKDFGSLALQFFGVVQFYSVYHEGTRLKRMDPHKGI